MGFGVWCYRFRVEGLTFWVKAFSLKVLKSLVLVLVFRVYGFGFSVLGLEFRELGFGSRV